MLGNYPLLLLPFVAMKRLLDAFYERLWLPLKSALYSILFGIKLGSNVKFKGKTYIRSCDKRSVEIGDNCTFLSGTANNFVGLMNPTVICASKGAKIKIGYRSGFSSVIIHAKSSITIGDYVNVGGNVRIFDHDFHSLDWRDRRPPPNGAGVRSSPVVIEDDVFIGTNAILLKGTHVGARSIIAAGSVVFGLDIPPDSMVKGNPARITGRRCNE